MKFEPLVLVHGLVSIPSKIMPFSIGPFPNRSSVGSYPPVHGHSVSPTKVLGCLGSNFLSSRVARSFQWIPGHDGLLGNKLADSLAKTGQRSPLPMLPAHWPRPLQRLGTLATLWSRNLSHNSLSCQIPSVSSEELGPYSSHPL